MRIDANAWRTTGAMLWLLLCAAGMGSLWAYAGEPGSLGTPRDVWALDAQIPLDPDRPTLVLFAHPRCPCTSASMSSIERLAGRFPDGFRFVAIFYEPDGAGPAWRSTSLWSRAASLPGASTVPDVGGRLAMRAGAATSGVVGLYEPTGQLLFWGGVTPSRGHQGDNPGTDAIAEALRGSPDHHQSAPVFGCSILGECADTVCDSGGKQP